jgi:hypothetical protein
MNGGKGKTNKKNRTPRDSGGVRFWFENRDDPWSPVKHLMKVRGGMADFTFLLGKSRGRLQ